MDITLGLFVENGIELLCVAQGAQGADGQNLGLATGEQTGTVCTRQNANLSSQRTNLFHTTAVNALALNQPVTNDLLLQLVEALGDLCAVLSDILLAQLSLELVADNLDACVADGLVVGIQAVLQLTAALSLELVEDLMVEVVMLVLELGLADLCLDVSDEGNNLLNLLMCNHQSVEHVVLRYFVCACLDHNDLVSGCADGNVHLGALALLSSRVDDNLTVNNAADDVVKRNIRDRNRDRRTQQSGYLGRVIGIVLQNGADDGNVVAQVLGEQRTHGAVNLAGSQDCLLRGTALAAHEGTGDAANCVQTLLEINREREEVDAVAGLCRGGRGDQNNGLAVANQAGAVCQLCQLAGLNNQRTASISGLKHAVVLKFKVVDVAHLRMPP